jgi:hypothetical protein
LLYRLSYITESWYPIVGLNHSPIAYQAIALPLS